jgi:hypothetical protein
MSLLDNSNNQSQPRLVLKLLDNSNLKPIRLGITLSKQDKSISISKADTKQTNNESKSSYFNYKHVFNSNGCKNEHLNSNKNPVIINRSFHIDDQCSTKTVNVEMVSSHSSVETNLVKKSSLKIPSKEISIKTIPKVDEAEITNYFKSSFRSSQSKEEAKLVDSNGAGGNIPAQEDDNIRSYMKKFNFFEESGGFSENDLFVD